MNGKVLNERTLVVNPARPREERGGGGMVVTVVAAVTAAAEKAAAAAGDTIRNAAQDIK